MPDIIFLGFLKLEIATFSSLGNPKIDKNFWITMDDSHFTNESSSSFSIFFTININKEYIEKCFNYYGYSFSHLILDDSHFWLHYFMDNHHLGYIKKNWLKRKKKKEGLSSLKNIIHQQVFVQLKIIITSIGFSFLIKKHTKQPT